VPRITWAAFVLAVPGHLGGEMIGHLVTWSAWAWFTWWPSLVGLGREMIGHLGEMMGHLVTWSPGARPGCGRN
jgi:hypothetical protein